MHSYKSMLCADNPSCGAWHLIDANDTQRIRSRSVRQNGRRARSAGPSRNFGCGFCGATGS